jgi:hypothetical protein
LQHYNQSYCFQLGTSNVEILFSLACIVPLLNIVKNLIELAQTHVFVIALVQVINLLTHGKHLDEMFFDPFNIFKSNSFAYF